MKCTDILEAWDDLVTDLQAEHERDKENWSGLSPSTYQSFLRSHEKMMAYYHDVRAELVKRLGADLTAELLVK